MRAPGAPRPAPLPATSSGQGEPSRYRLRYSKLGPAAFLAHLDLVRHLPRAFRRAGLEIYYSRGFHPKPGVSFGPALGLGIPSLGEWLDVKLVDRVEAEELLRRLREVSPPGVTFLDAQVLAERDPPLGRVIAQADYALRLPTGYSSVAAAARWESGEPLVATRRERSDSRRPDRGNEVDVRKSMVFARVPDAGERALLAEHLGWEPGDADPARLLTFGLVVSAFGSARPVEVVEALLGQPTAAAELVRLRLAPAP